MTRPENPGTPDSRDELRLRQLLETTMAGIEPDDRLNQIRSRTKVTAMSTRPSWLWGAGGAALATAAVITAVALIGNPLKQTSDPGPVGTPTVTETVTDSGQPSPTETTPPVSGEALPVYFVGDTPQGPRLFREFQANVDGTEPVSTAVSLALGEALDPDYRSDWPADAEVTTAGVTKDLITIGLSGDLHDRPAGMSAAEAELAIQQLIYTAQAAYGEGRVPVQFLLNDSHTDQILGQPASEPLAEGDWTKTLAFVSISDPAEGATVSGTLHVTGQASSFEATVPYQLKRGAEVVKQGSFMAEGWMEHLYPFDGDIDISDLAPGTYTLVCSTDDPSGGAEGFGPTSDTRTIVVE